MRRDSLGRVTAWLVTLIILFVFNFPLLNTVLTSLKDPMTIAQFPPVWVFQPTLENYRAIFSDPTIPFQRYLFNSVIISLGSAALTLIVSLPAGYAMGRLGVGRRVVLPVVASLRAIPYIIFAIPIYIMFQRAGLIDSYPALILINTAINVPLAVVLFTTYLQEIPEVLEEAAVLDGGSPWQIFRYIIIPLSRPIMASVIILSAIMTWNEFLFGLILSVERVTPVTVGTTMYITSWTIKWGNIAAAMTLGVLPSLILCLTAQRLIVRGLTAGAVKG